MKKIQILRINEKAGTEYTLKIIKERLTRVEIQHHPTKRILSFQHNMIEIIT